MAGQRDFTSKFYLGNPGDAYNRGLESFYRRRQADDERNRTENINALARDYFNNGGTEEGFQNELNRAGYPGMGQKYGAGVPSRYSDVSEMPGTGGRYGQKELKSNRWSPVMSGNRPSSVQEWEVYNSLAPQEKEQYLDMKRQNYGVTDIGEVPTMYRKGDSRQTQPLSTLKDETMAAQKKKQAEKLGASSAKTASESFSQYNKITANISNLNKVISLVEKEGASTGPLVSKLPSFRTASISLDNMRNRLGLDVIGAVTFGALSKGELDLALNTALPPHKGKALVEWAKDKVSAQTKLAKYFKDQSIFLSQPGATQAGWLESQSGKKQSDIQSLVDKYAD